MTVEMKVDPVSEAAERAAISSHLAIEAEQVWARRLAPLRAMNDILIQWQPLLLRLLPWLIGVGFGSAGLLKAVHAWALIQERLGS